MKKLKIILEGIVTVVLFVVFFYAMFFIADILKAV